MGSANDVWEMALLQRVHPTAILAWFDDLKPISFDGDTLILSTPNDVKKNVLNTKFLTIISEIFEELFSSRQNYH